MPTYDAIVLGAGAVGSAAAYYLTQAGQRVLVLEQFELDHQKGSSYGESRIIRYSYDFPQYIALMKAAYPLWAALEDAAGETLYFKTGGLDFGPADDPMLLNTFVSVQTAGIAHEELSPTDAMQRFPQFRFEDGWRVLYQPDSGYLAASRCVLAHLRLAEQRGATIMANAPVTAIQGKGDGIEVQTPAARYTAARLIVSAGAWAKELLDSTGLVLPLQPMRCQLSFFAGTPPENYNPEHFPVFIAHLHHLYGHHVPYGIPSHAGTGLKVAFHGGAEVTHPREVDYTPSEQPVTEIRKFMARHIPEANGKLLDARVCLYTMTPDEHFVVGTHPEYPQMIIASPCSGHGFKFSTLIGRILCDLALQGNTPHDISLFSVTRFMHPTQ